VRSAALAAFAILATYGELAAAEPARVNMTYVRKDAAATDCPDEATFRTLVIARLGYDPFDKSGSLALRVEFRPQGTEIAGSILLTGNPGEKPTNRTLRDADCFELASSMALATAIAVDPDAVRAGGAPPPKEPEPKPVPPPTPPPPPPKPKPPPDEEPRSLWEPTSPGGRITATFVMPVGLTPAPRGGVRAGLGIEGNVWSVVAEGVFFFPSSREESFGTVSSYIAHGSLVPCAHLPLHPIVLLDLCTVGSVGAMFSDAENVERPDPQTHLFATIGPRAGLTVMPWPNVGFEATFDVPVNLERAHLVIEDRGVPREVWAASRVGFVGGLGLVFHFP
jgi:hypothetical protein